ncbi:hypothetical protein W822_22705 [Advenella kashmirensis W13003]|uniref:Uncharacterized protein n=1 Tax=Advenella kashmirensis W13003 TaxID=1424334 RepID=V8QK41_9BURK|nr:hypothetical protein [Advenella kashmirensis]ETF00316.1 hypothetical protein W822_22705 [Advenella kashmirensis W13003]
MNMDYREPRNGDFANYVEELSRHFDMKEQAVNPDFSSGFPSQLTTTGAARSAQAGAAATARTSGTRQASASNASADTSFPVPPSGTQNAGFETRPAATPKAKTRSFPFALVVGLVAVAIFILADEFGSGGSGLQAEGMRGPLIFILIVLFIIFKRIRNAAKRFPTPSKTTKQT